MAFNIKNFSVLAGQGKRDESFQLFAYISNTDSETDMVADNYFAELRGKSSVGDIIMIENNSGDGDTLFHLKVVTISNTGLVEVEKIFAGIDTSNLVPYVGADKDVDLGAYDLTANEIRATDITSDTATIDEITTNQIDFTTTEDNPTFKEGRLFYDKEKKALSYYNEESGITVNLAQEVLLRIENQTGSTIPNGTIITPDETTIITLADNKFKDKSQILAVMTHDLLDGEMGYATKVGQVGGLDTSMYSAGQTLYLGNSGQFSTTKPTDGGYVATVAVVDVVSATDGIITVDINPTDITVEVTDTNGFPPDQRENTTLLAQNTRLFTIIANTGDFHYYELGDKFESAGDSITWSDQEGEHWFFFEEGVLKTEHDPSLPRKEHIILNHAFIATVYWNATDSKVEIDVLDERHGISMSPQTHLYLHQTRGAQHLYGFQLGDVNADASGDLNTSAQYSVSAGEFADEDIRHDSSTVAVGDTIPVVYNIGADANLRSESQTGFAVLNAPAGRLYYNEFTGGAWQLTEVSNNDFVLYHDFAINGQDVANIVVMGQAEYTTRNQARNAAPEEISNLIAQLPFDEMIPVATKIYQTSSGYDNDVQARIISTGDGDYISWIDTEITQGSAPSSHLNLTDVQQAGSGISQGHIDDQAQTIAGVKTFSDSPIVPTPTTDFQAATKKYVDDNGGGGGGGASYSVDGGVIPKAGFVSSIPSLTSDTDQSYVISASTTLSGYNPWESVDGIFSGSVNRWVATTTTGWWQAQLPSAKAFQCYKIWGAENVDQTPNTWTIEASNTGAFAGEEVTLDTVSGETGWTQYEERTFCFNNTTSYLYYRINITANDGDASYVSMQQIQFSETQTTGVDITELYDTLSSDRTQTLAVSADSLDITLDASWASGTAPTLIDASIHTWADYNSGTQRYILDDSTGSNIAGAKRRVGSFITDSSGDIVPFITTGISGGGYELSYSEIIETSTAPTSTYSNYSLSVPVGIELKVEGLVYGDSTGAVGYILSKTNIELEKSLLVYSAYNASSRYCVKTDDASVDLKISGSSINSSFTLRTDNFTDWRMD